MDVPIAALAGLFSALCWGTGSLLLGRLFQGAPPHARPSAAAANLFKNALALAVFALLWTVWRGPWPDLATSAGLAWSGFLGFALGDTLYFAAIARCGVQTSLLIGLLNVPIATVVGWAALGEELGPRVFLWMALVLAGVALVVLEREPRGGAPPRDARHFRAGVLFAVAMAVGQALSVVVGRGVSSDVHLLTGCMARIFGGVLGAFVLGILVGLPRRRAGAEVASLLRPFRLRAMALPLVLVALPASVINLLPFFMAMRDLPSGISSVLFNTTPLFTLVLGIPLLGLRPGGRSIAGTLLGFAGVVGLVLGRGGTQVPEPGSERAPLPALETDTEQEAAERGAPRALEAPAPAGALWPRPAAGPDGELLLSWIEPTRGGHRLRLSVRAGDAWSAPRTVAQGAGWFVNWADFPAVAAAPGGRIAAVWLDGLGDGAHAYGLRLAHSRDGGARFDAPRSLHADTSATEHGFVSLVPLPDGSFFSAWLDGRAMAAGGPMQLRCARITPQGVVEEERALDGRVCECCQTDAALLASGEVLVAWRDRDEDELRDVAWARGLPGDPASWSAPSLVHEDGWRIAGCPVNGPAVATDGTRAAIAWFTLGSDGRARVLVARSGGEELDFGAPLRLGGDGVLGRVDAAYLAEGRLVVTWLEATAGGEGASWRGAVVEAAGLAAPSRELAPASGARSDGFLRVAPFGEGLALAVPRPEGGILLREWEP